MFGRPVHLHVTKYDGSPHWEEDLWYVMERGSLLVLQGFRGRHPYVTADPRQPPYDFTRFLWYDRWYNVVRLVQRGAGLFGCYCNIATPAQFDGANAHYVDLDLGVMVTKDRHWEVRGQEKFAESASHLAYPADVVREAHQAVQEIIGLVEQGQLPFQV